MSNKRLMKRLTAASLSAAVAFTGSSFAYAAGQALPEGTVVDRGGAIYLTDSQGNQYSGWYVDGNEDWYYFDDSNKAMKTGWHHDGVDG